MFFAGLEESTKDMYDVACEMQMTKKLDDKSTEIDGQLKLIAQQPTYGKQNVSPVCIRSRDTPQNYIYASIEAFEKDDGTCFLGVLQAAERGYGILDLGATSSICGIDGAEALVTALRSRELKVTMDTSKKNTFVFGNGRTMQCTGKAYFPFTLAGIEGQLGVNILDAKAPLLIGIDVLTRLGAVIDCGEETIYFKKLGRREKLHRLSSGHLAIPVLPEGLLGPLDE